MKKILLAVSLLGTGIAFADEPAKPAEPATPATPADPAKPADPATPAEPATPATPAVTVTPAPTGAMDTKPTPGAVLSSTTDDGGVHATSGNPEKASKIALEISGAGAGVANPYVEYKGWQLKTGASKGFRLEANLIGIQLAYELSSMANDEACSSSSCVPGSGSTVIHSIELGYRYRFRQLGPVRPFLAASIGGVLANSGTWSMATDKTVKGGSARGALGVEIPFMKKFFASVTLAYRVVVTENPLYTKDASNADKFLLGTGDPPNGDYAEDLHLVSGYVGVGVQL